MSFLRKADAPGLHHASHESGGADAFTAALDLVAIPAHSYDQHTDITRKIFIAATAFFGGAGEDALVSGNRPAIFFPDAADCVCYFSFYVPDDYVSFTNLKAIWIADVAAGLFMRWKFAIYYGTQVENLNIHSDLPAYGQTANVGANLLNYQEPANPATLANLAVGDEVGVAVHREGTNVADTIGAVVKIHGVLLEYVARQ